MLYGSVVHSSSVPVSNAHEYRHAGETRSRSASGRCGRAENLVLTSTTTARASSRLPPDPGCPMTVELIGYHHAATTSIVLADCICGGLPARQGPYAAGGRDIFDGGEVVENEAMSS